MIYLGVIFIIWLEVSQPPTDICTSQNFSATPEMCDVGFHRGKNMKIRETPSGVVQIYYTGE